MSSSSSLSDLVRDRIGVTHYISEKSLDQSSLLESLQEKTQDLLRSKEETIALQSQLQIVKETCSLQDAEFAFQRSQYETDLQLLRDRQTELLDRISQLENEKITNQKYNVDVAMKQEPTKNPKYLKWKSRCREAQQSSASKESSLAAEIADLKAKLAERPDSENLTHQLNKTLKKLRKARETNESLATDLSNLNAKLAKSRQSLREAVNASATLQDEKTALESELKRANSQLRKMQRQLENLSDEHNSLASSSHGIANQLSSVEQENAHLQHKSNSLSKQVERLKAIEDEYARLHAIIEHVELERDTIADILGVEPGDIAGSWSLITEKLETLVSDLEALSGVRGENEKLQRRLDAALADVRNRQSGPTQENAEYEKMLALDLKRARNELEQKTALVTCYAARQQILEGCVNQFTTMTRELRDLHAILCSAPTISMRPCLLAVICIRRMFSRNRGEFDPMALAVFAGRQATVALQMSEIRAQFTELSRQLLIAKQTVIDDKKELSQVLEERDIAQLTLRSNNRELKINRKKMEVLTARMLELQNELTSLVSPEAYGQVCDRLAKDTDQLASLQARVKELETELEKMTVAEGNMNDTIEILQATADRNAETAEQARVQCSQKDEAIEALKALLRERTREVLNRERTIQKQADNESSNTSIISCLAVENQGLRQNRSENDVEQRHWKAEPNLQPLTAINPAFLGQ